MAIPKIAVSINEAESLALKAARGSGLAWGVAEEVGYACRWLAERGLPFEEALLRVLTEDLKSPIHAGITLSDAARETVGRCPLALGAIAEPVLLLPFIANVARATSVALQLAWQDGSFVLTPEAAFSTVVRSTELLLSHWQAAPGSPLTPLGKGNGGVLVRQSAWLRLSELAARTYVPESAASRQKGAGSSGGEQD